MNNIGIYCVFWKEILEKFYVGLSSNLDKRIAWHKSMLISKKHKNNRLQEAFNLYGMPEFFIIENCPLESLKDREIFWIKELNSYRNGFNITNGGDGSGYGEAVHSALYTEDVYLDVLNELAYTDSTYEAISNKLNVTLNTIKHIARLSSHSWMQQVSPEAYSVLKSKKGNRASNTAKGKGIEYPELICPAGIVYSSIDNLHEFCREHGLQAQNLHKVLIGQRMHHKGWRLYAGNN